jgi:hypothetical protein
MQLKGTVINHISRCFMVNVGMQYSKYTPSTLNQFISSWDKTPGGWARMVSPLCINITD